MLVEWQDRKAFEDALVVGDEVLIGQTLLEKLDLIVDCTNKQLLQNPANPDRPVFKIE